MALYHAPLSRHASFMTDGLSPSQFHFYARFESVILAFEFRYRSLIFTQAPTEPWVIRFISPRGLAGDETAPMQAIDQPGFHNIASMAMIFPLYFLIWKSSFRYFHDCPASRLGEMTPSASYMLRPDRLRPGLYIPRPSGCSLLTSLRARFAQDYNLRPFAMR